MNKITQHDNFKTKSKNYDVLDEEVEIQDYEFAWKEVKFNISQDVRTIVWKAWIEPLIFLKYNKCVLYLSAESFLMSTRVETQYYETIFFQAKKKFTDIKKIKVLNKKLENSVDQNKILPIVDINNSKLIPKFKEQTSFLTSASLKLNAELTFDNFVVGKSNEMPFAASKRVSNSISSSYNPLYIHGEVGLGKTHLLNAIALDMSIQNPSLKVVYMSAERFMYQFIKAIRSKDTIKFKDQFRSVDVLLIDDIQFIGGKGSTQEEFFYTFNDLIDQKKQIVITSNKPPIGLLDLDEKLKSRLGGGLVVDFLPTDFDLRLDILNKKVNSLPISIPNDVLDFLATNIINNIRELEGALNRVCANHELTGRNITLENTEELLSDLLTVFQKKISIELIQQNVSSYFNLTVSEMAAPRRSINIARPRQIAMYLSKEITSFSYPEIGKAFGGKDHTTIMHAVKKIESLSDKDLKLKKDLIELRKLIRSN